MTPQTIDAPGVATNNDQGLTVTGRSTSPFILTAADLAATEYPVDEQHERDLAHFFAGARSMQPLLDQAIADRDRYYAIACRGGFGKPASVERGFPLADLLPSRGRR